MNAENRRRALSAFRFLLAAAAVQAGLIFFGTCGALEGWFPLCVRALSEEVTLGDSSYTEYYAIRSRLSETEADVIVIGVDFGYQETYSLLLDLIAALKNDVNIGTILVDAYPGTMGVVSATLSAESAETQATYLDWLRDSGGCSDCFCTFVRELAARKTDYPPQRQYKGGSLIAGEETDSNARKMAASVLVYRQTTDRPVLVLTDTDELQFRSELRTALSEYGLRDMCIRCHYENGDAAEGDGEAEIMILDAENLSGVDALYAAAARKANGTYPTARFSQLYTTEVSFHMYNCTPVQPDTTEEQ